MSKLDGQNRSAVEYAIWRTENDGELRYVYRDRRGSYGPMGRRWYVQAPYGVDQDKRPAGVECIAKVYRETLDDGTQRVTADEVIE